ncbi:Zn-ribbon domain-containing OB-fold protein [Ferrovibrio sp. MS7]|uniref:Zn-ribbon domain-containing OB-fold protein n=1 Tax=Ferrovibrio plantarum TaxID=3119164 RepID=UPI00313496AE
MSFPQPDIMPLSAPYWDGLKQGKLLFQQCRACGNRWLPARDACPNCLKREAEWVESSGRGRIVSWVVYHVSYNDAFKDRVPYDVTLVELDEGPRLLSNIVNGDAGRKLSLHASVALQIEHEGDLALARFKLV